MKKIFVIGSSGHAKVVIDIIEKEGKYEIVGLLSRDQAAGEFVFGYEILGKEADLPKILNTHPAEGFIIAVGDNATRAKVAKFLEENHPELKAISAVHPSAIIGKDVTIGAGTVIMAGTIINPSTRIGEHCIINTRASIDHDNSIGNFTSIAPGVTTGGDCTIGAFCAIGIGATLLHGIQIGKQTVIGANALVNKNIPLFSVAYGVPAKVVRQRKAGNSYL